MSYYPHQIPLSTRQHYERVFMNEAHGKPYLNAVEAATLFLERGLTKEEVSKIWEDSDQDHDGRLGKEEFVQAMWKIDFHTGRARSDQMNSSMSEGQSNHLAYGRPQAYGSVPTSSPQHYERYYSTYNPISANTAPVQHWPSYESNHQQSGQTQVMNPIQQGTPKAELLTATCCKACGVGLVPSDSAYRSSTDFFCTTCPRPPTSVQVVLVAGKGIQKYKPSVLSGCSACWREFKKRQMIWRCKKCWDKTLCEKCWKKVKRHCKHVSTGQVIMMRVVDGKYNEDNGDDNPEDGGNDGGDDDGLEDVIDAIDAIVSIVV
ncbi:cytoskeletal-regulatory complex EF hand domain protein [Fusarium beomiforme]|uniref:Cytoskeletal-regulatory complex EF hand domain protein n=1 Tax=Fusarium beomiforme TaxID=44412 RepID=A0A9P5DVN4_9HYPO|nr:cytoskeletal-regulatory complex EF hand domain protein [Fusarium beomiforme]